jgi:hypothetical protein
MAHIKAFLLAAVVVTLGHGVAHAQATRTWVSGVGDDANPCSRTAPCKTFAGAISKTAQRGEISVLDPGGFGAVTITKGITINGDGTLASILSSGTNGVTVNAPGAVVVLRNLSINGGSTGLNGIRVIAAAAVHVENVTIHGVTLAGVTVEPTAATSLFLRNVRISDASTGVQLLNVDPPPAPPELAFVLRAHLEDVQVLGGSVGLDARGATAVARNCVLSGQQVAGVHSRALSEVTLEGGVIFGGTTAIQADSTVLISDTLVAGNTTGLAGTVTSFGNNRLGAGNTTPGAPTSTLPLQ